MRLRNAITFALVLVAAGCGQHEAVHTERATAAPAAERAAPRPNPFRRVALIGASASDGFGTSIDYELDGMRRNVGVDMADIFRAMIEREHDAVTSHASYLFFMDPETNGADYVAAALEDDPTLVIGLDFLFWFSHGSVTDESKRTQMLEDGLALLDRFECPVVVGDLPDMTGANPLMLAASSIPAAETRTQLNERIRAWAADGGHVVVPLDTYWRSARATDVVTFGAVVWDQSVTPLMQGDGLHPTTNGLIAMLQLTVATLADTVEGAAVADFALDPRSIRERIVAETVEAQTTTPGG